MTNIEKLKEIVNKGEKIEAEDILGGLSIFMQLCEAAIKDGSIIKIGNSLFVKGFEKQNLLKGIEE